MNLKLTEVRDILWQSSALIVALYAADRLFRRRIRPALRYALWMLALVKLCLPPSFHLPTSPAYWLSTSGPAAAVDRPTLPPSQAATDRLPPPYFASQAPAAARAVPDPWTWSDALCAIWICGALLLGSRAIRNGLKLALIRERASAAPPDLLRLFAACRAELGIHGRVTLTCSSECSIPGLVGWIDPQVIIPDSLPRHLPRNELRAVLMHELLHFQRNDVCAASLQTALQIVYWFNPLVWLANRCITAVREEAVDEAVRVALGIEADRYPDILLHVARLAASPIPPVLNLGMLDPKRRLQNRIALMFERPAPSAPELKIGGWALVAVLGAVVLPMASRSETSVPINRPPGTSSTEPLASKAEHIGEMVKGFHLTSEQAQKLETQSAAHPDDLSIRIELLGYYQPHRRDAGIAALRNQHIFWLIEHAPHVSMPVASSIRLQEAGYAYAKDLWLGQIASHPTDLVILRNASEFFRFADASETEALLRKGKALAPNDPAWDSELAQLYRMRALKGSPDDSRRALNAMEAADQKTVGQFADQTHFYNWTTLAKMAYAAGDYDKAQTYAARLLQAMDPNRGNWNFGNAVNTANVVLGRIALRAGRRDDAASFLLAAGDTPGSPQLNSFGPNMALARDLLRAGDQDTVLAYFEECRKFWKSGGSKLDAWSRAISEGHEPEFGANLNY